LSRRGDHVEDVSALRTPRCGICGWHVDCKLHRARRDAEFTLQATPPLKPSIELKEKS
jgi:hypothetical protein